MKLDRFLEETFQLSDNALATLDHQAGMTLDTFSELMEFYDSDEDAAADLILEYPDIAKLFIEMFVYIHPIMVVSKPNLCYCCNSAVY